MPSIEPSAVHNVLYLIYMVSFMYTICGRYSTSLGLYAIYCQGAAETIYCIQSQTSGVSNLNHGTIGVCLGQVSPDLSISPGPYKRGSGHYGFLSLILLTKR